MSRTKRPTKTKHRIVTVTNSKRSTTYLNKPKYYGDRLKDGFDAVNPDIW